MTSVLRMKKAPAYAASYGWKKLVTGEIPLANTWEEFETICKNNGMDDDDISFAFTHALVVGTADQQEYPIEKEQLITALYWCLEMWDAADDMTFAEVVEAVAEAPNSEYRYEAGLINAALKYDTSVFCAAASLILCDPNAHHTGLSLVTAMRHLAAERMRYVLSEEMNNV